MNASPFPTIIKSTCSNEKNDPFGITRENSSMYFMRQSTLGSSDHFAAQASKSYSSNLLSRAKGDKGDAIRSPHVTSSAGRDSHCSAMARN